MVKLNPMHLEIPVDQPIAIISDIHANITALEAVLNDVRSRGLTRIVCLGDVVGKGPSGAACVDAIRALECPVVMGNWDLLVADKNENQHPAIHDALEWERAQLGAERLEWLRDLPYALDLERHAGLVRLLHASPQGLWHRVGMKAILSGRADKIAGMFADTELTGHANRKPQAVGYGDIHTAFVINLPAYMPELQAVKHRTLFNVGSVGNPMDAPVPAYAILGGGAGLEITIVRVPYDNEQECRIALEAKMPYLEEYLEETRFARYRPRGATKD
jgi:protein phosphatase